MWAARSRPHCRTSSAIPSPSQQYVFRPSQHCYTYDASKRVTAVQTTAGGKTYKNAYTYENDRIKTVSHNTTSDTSDDVTYTFGYDSLGRKTTVKVGSQTLSTNLYNDDRNGLLKEVQYGNGGRVRYEYDDFDRLTRISWDNATVPRYLYDYDASGRMSEVTDRRMWRTLKTEYDLDSRLAGTELRSLEGELLYRTRLSYDKFSRVVGFNESVRDLKHKTTYAYDRDDRVTEITYDGNAHKVKYTYDNLGRIETRTAECGVEAGKVTSTYSYVEGGYGTNSTTPLVEKITQPKIPFEYAYDSRGNIVSEKCGTLTTTYSYDALGQLIRVNDPHENATWVYNYDCGGNILSKVKYAYTTGTLGTAQQTISYTYGDANWKDKLTAYNGTAISYDAIGNPLNDGTWTYTWQAGRQLKQMSKTGTTIRYEYNHEGLRTQKFVDTNNKTDATYYTYNGKNIIHVIKNSDHLHIFYDAQNRPAKVSHNGIFYTYLYNLQGDVVGLVDKDGTLVVEYKYDAWGKPLSITGTHANTLGKLNPFRYRGYVYDDETGLYYLCNRYYNAIWGRFLNSDLNYGKRKGFLSFNLFVYCANMPINNLDKDGHDFISWICDKWDDLCFEVPNFFEALEAEGGFGGGIGISGQISGVIDASAFAAIDTLRLTADDNVLSLDQSIVLEAGLTVLDEFGASISYRKPRSLDNPYEDVAAEFNYTVGYGKMGIDGNMEKADLVVGIGGSIGLGVAVHGSIGLNLNEWQDRRVTHYSKKKRRQQLTQRPRKVVVGMGRTRRVVTLM